MSSSKIFMTSIVIVLISTLSACHQKPATEEQVPFVMVTQPQSKQNQLKSYAGEVQARQQATLAFRVTGHITKRYVEVGDRVTEGQLLAELDVKDAQLQLNVSKAQLENARSAAKNAEQELNRYKDLLPINAVSRSQYDVVDNQYKAAISELKQAQANYNVSLNQTHYNQLRATKNGVITQRDIEIGQVVAAGQAAYQLAIDGDREVVIGVPEQAVSKMQVGQAAWVTLWSAPEQRFAATVREISPATDQSRTFRVKVALKEGQSQIQLGQSARVYFSENQDNVISVPLASISAKQNQAYAWVVKPDHTLHKVDVKLGAYGRDSVSIISGLNASNWVVVGGVHLLREGQKINPIDRDNRAVNIQSGAK
ncbi:efflux RND transporter periplasmic adaptor subunit [Acinetobacter sp. 194]|uniref:efflux RND transporter periplasmic adaptor subunit n=1 Tax=Acinetobacter shaoyimingii TaxID=2715164 RepID=UPI0014080DA5|nr:efflux RND transporter periplasmic adaptor subunit [Acinetobacter shaoyimingii]NHB59530.1 efflux RND transporter periplasmic adaptor subunit [Acinetobacter shaoyimingii]